MTNGAMVVAADTGCDAETGGPDRRVVVTWSLASGIASMIHQIAEWQALGARQSDVMQRILIRRFGAASEERRKACHVTRIELLNVTQSMRSYCTR